VLNITRRALIALVISCCFCFAGNNSALADAVPPIKTLIDANNVDILHGTHLQTGPTITIGAGDAALSTTFLGAYGVDSLAGVIHWGRLWDNNNNVVRDQMKVSFGGQSTSFYASGRVSWNPSTSSYSGNTYAPALGGSETLVENTTARTFTYTTSDGTQVVFQMLTITWPHDPSDYLTGPPLNYLEGRVKSVTKPDGETLVYNYGTLETQTTVSGGTNTYNYVTTLRQPEYYFPISASSNYGYQIRYNWQTYVSGNLSKKYLQRIAAVNSAVDYCDAASDICYFSLSWPSVTVSIVSTGTTAYGGPNQTDPFTVANTVASFTDPLGRVSKFITADIEHANGLKTVHAKGYESPGGGLDNSFSINYGNVNSRVAKDFTYLYDDFFQGTASETSYRYELGNYIPAGLDANGIYHPAMWPKTIYATDAQQHVRTVVVDVASDGVYTDTDALNRTTTYNYDAYARVIKITYPEGNSVNYSYDVRGNVTEIRKKPKPGSSLADIVETYGYDATCTNPKKCNKPNWSRDGNNNQTDYTYDATTGLVSTQTNPADSAGVRPQVRYTYTPLYAKVKNSAGSLVNAATPIYKLTKVSQCASATSANPASCVGTADEQVTTYTYNDSLWLASEKVASGNGSVAATTSYAYDTFGNRTIVDGPLPGSVDASITRYDAARQVLGTVAPDPDDTGPLLRQATRTTYNADGLVTLSETGYVSDLTESSWAAFSSVAQKETLYAGAGLVSQSNIKTGGVTYSVTQQNYDRIKRPICTALRMNPAVYGSLPTDACAHSTVGSNGPDRITQNVYDVAGQLLQTWQGVGTTNSRAYLTTAYSSNGQPIYSIDSNGNRTTMNYDGFDRPASIVYPSTTRPSAFNPSTPSSALSSAGTSNATDYEQFTYDANSNRKTWRRRSGQSITYTYDKLNRQVIADVPAHPSGAYNATEKDVYTTYDLMGRVKKKAFASYTGQGNSYTYNALGWLATATDMNNRSISYLYNAAGARVQMTDASSYVINYDLDNLSRVKRAFLNGLTNVLYGYTYNNLGQRTLLSRGASGVGGTTTYAYDNLGRLQGIANDQATAGYDITWGKVGTVGAVAYNPANQITTWASSSTAFDYVETATAADNRTFDGLNRDAAVAAVSGGYDTNGNLTKDAPRTFIYDIYNRLLTVSGGASNISLVYDPEGRLAKTTTATSSKDYVYDGGNLIGEYVTDATTPASRYIFGSGTDEPIVWLKGADDSDRRYYYSNYQGSIIGYTGPTGQFLAASLTKYGAYGEPRNSANAETWSGTRFGYTGQVVLPEAYLYYYKARVYDPKFGRFLQTDPVGSKDDLNLYAYVGGDPINKIDPTGTEGGFWDGFGEGVSYYNLSHYAEGQESAITLPKSGSSEGWGFVVGYGAMGSLANSYSNVNSGALRGNSSVPARTTTGTPAAGPYAHLVDPPNVAPGKNFSRSQKAQIYAANLAKNGGVLRSDQDGSILVMPQKSQKGVTPPPNEANVDHRTPKKPADPTVKPGDNSFGNAALLSREQNGIKSNK